MSTLFVCIKKVAGSRGRNHNPGQGAIPPKAGTFVVFKRATEVANSPAF